VLTNLVQGGLMTEGEVIDARRHPATAVDRSTKEAPDFFLDWAYEQTLDVARKQDFSDHTLIVRTTLDAGLQHAAEQAVETGLRQYGETYRVKQGAMVVIENGGAVRAMVGGRDYGENQFNRATKALRQPGSSFKIYTYALAMEKGMTPTTSIVDGPICWGNWCPGNYGNSYAGRIDMQTAIAKSINTIPVRLTKEKFGKKPMDQIVALAKKFGVETPLRNDVTIPLGSSEVTVMDQATAYAVFPAGGLESRRHGISQITDYEGKTLYDFERDAPPAKRVLTQQAADYMNQMLTRIPYVGTARKAAVDGVLTGGKTGTTQAYRDAWFCGYTGNFAAAVWYGNDDYTSSNNMTGGSLPAMTFKLVMDYAHQGLPIRPVPGVEVPPEIAEQVNKEKPVVEKAEGTADAAPTFIRPRMLTVSGTRVVKDIGERLKDAKPLKKLEKVASAE
jgi:penicillin-binding protein 1A